jgi:hypothetical protein
MKIQYFKRLFSLLMLFTIVLGCEKDEELIPVEPEFKRNEISIECLNPNTGESYTLEELGLLFFDPTIENYFDSTQSIEIDVFVLETPIKVDALNSSGTVIASTSEFEIVDETHKARFDFSVLELGLELLESTHLTFLASYGENAKESYGTIIYKIGHIKEFIPVFYESPVKLVKLEGDTLDLAIEADDENLSDGGIVGTIIDHAGSYATIGDAHKLSFREENDFSVGIWVRTTNDQDDPAIIGDKDWGSGGNPGFLFCQIGTNWKLNMADVNSTRIDIKGTDINDGGWHFLMATFDRDGEVAVYTDGIKNGAEDMSALGSMATGLALNIAEDGTGSYGSWRGKTAGTYIYNYALSEEEAILAGNTGVTLKKSDGTQSPLIVDNQSSMVAVEDGKVVYTFDGVDDFVTIDSIRNLDFRYESDYSVSFWVNTTSTDSDPVMFGDQDWGSSGNKGLTVAFRGDNWRTAYADGNEKADERTSDIPFNDGAWHLLTVTFDRDGEMKMYQDGVMVESADMTAVTSSDSGNPLRLAQDGTGMYGQNFEGKIANTVIYDYVLTDQEITDLFNE